MMEGGGKAAAVKIVSTHRAKGTELSRVVVIGAGAGVVPLDWVFANQPESEHPAVRALAVLRGVQPCPRRADRHVVGCTEPVLASASRAAASE